MKSSCHAYFIHKSHVLTMHYKQEMTKGEVPSEFVKLAFAHLEAAEQLNWRMCHGAWPPDFFRGQTVLWLAFHAIELFLKGCILKLDARTCVNGHSLAKLVSMLTGLDTRLAFELPFGVEAASADPQLVELAEKAEGKIHEVLRYPVDKQNRPWQGVRSFSPKTFQQTLAATRYNCEKIHAQLF